MLSLIFSLDLNNFSDFNFVFALKVLFRKFGFVWNVKELVVCTTVLQKVIDFSDYNIEETVCLHIKSLLLIKQNL